MFLVVRITKISLVVENIYQALITDSLRGVACLVEKRRFTQPLLTLRMNRTSPLVPVVPQVRLILLFIFL
jgi:hypothetical protein